MTNVLLNWYTRPDFLAYQFSDRDNFCLDLARRVWGVQEVSWTIRSKEDLLACEKFGSIGILRNLIRNSNENRGSMSRGFLSASCQWPPLRILSHFRR